MKTSSILPCAVLALSACSTFQAHAANPTDHGSPWLYKYQYWVDNTSSCRAPLKCGTQAAPFATLKEAFDKLQPHTEIIIAGHAGKPYYPTADGQPGPNPFANQQFLVTGNLKGSASQKATLIRGWNLGNNVLVNPVFRGSLRFGGWTPVDESKNIYSRPWNLVAQGTADPDPQPPDNYVYRVMDPQQVYRGETKLEQVGGQLYKEYGRSDTTAYEWPERTAGRPIGRIVPADTQPWLSLSDNQFYYAKGKDHDSPKTLYIKLATPLAQDEQLEVSTQQFLLDTAEAFNLTLKNLTFERSSGSSFSSQNSAVNINGYNIVLDGVTVQDADAICLHARGSKITVQNSKLQRCGQIGLTASGADSKFINNTIQYNNVKGFNEWWAAGGIKIIGNGGLKKSEISGNTVAYNQGHGIWLDTDPSFITIKDNNVVFNGANGVDGGGIGVFIEITNDNEISGNKIVGNKNQGIQLKGSRNKVTANLIVGNTGPGTMQLPDSREASQSGNVFSSNLFAWNEEGINGMNAHRKGIGLLKGSSANGNKYCGTDVRYMLDSMMFYDLPSWRAQKMDTSSSSRETLKPYPLRANLTQPLLLGDNIIGRNPQVVTDTKSGALAAAVKKVCGW